ncbi:hypothetical protein PhCBS80983_g03440 [Powellomyces hirtus]|uniref:Vacuolar transporter chaperone complex subunit 4 n=1 Tax=Powellomyces hirtus TaxID=109895 RepID=A0A507E2B4_9FUNG|nr:hypothetical protein PhCBS80983_g03440 [Powellomyces hirtus]
MKFGNYLAEETHPEWAAHYIAYEDLKQQLKAEDFGPSSEILFTDTLSEEIEKVHRFKATKWTEFNRRTTLCRKKLHASLANSNTASASASATSTTLEADYDYETEIYDIAAQIKQLYAFLRLNHTAVLKILKKHDKRTGFTLKSVFLLRMQQKGYTKDDFDPLLYSLSELWDQWRLQGEREKVEAPSGGGNFVRKTKKYWVHADNVTAVKLHIMEHLPVLLFKGDSEPDPAISSIYFDNGTFDLYHDRMEKREGAEALRLRFYGKTSNPLIYVERKTHHEPLSGLESVKERFPIKEKNVNAFLRGEYSMDKVFAKMRQEGKIDEEEIEAQEKMAREVQKSVMERGLKPAVRTFYNRTAFQLPGDNRVRMSLDTQLCMIREDNNGVERSGRNWRRTDVGTVYPFHYLHPADVIEFPYAVLEVKLQSHIGVEAPAWVKALTSGHLVEGAPKFSKFGHGVAQLFPDQVNILPMWLSQVEMDIRKPVPADIADESDPTTTKRNSFSSHRTSGMFSTPLADWDSSLSSKRSASQISLKAPAVVQGDTTNQQTRFPSPASASHFMGRPAPAAEVATFERVPIRFSPTSPMPFEQPPPHRADPAVDEIEIVTGGAIPPPVEPSSHVIRNAKSDETLVGDPIIVHDGLHIVNTPGTDGRNRHVSISMLDAGGPNEKRPPLNKKSSRNSFFKGKLWRMSSSSSNSSAFNPFMQAFSSDRQRVPTTDGETRPPRRKRTVGQVMRAPFRDFMYGTNVKRKPDNRFADDFDLEEGAKKKKKDDGDEVLTEKADKKAKKVRKEIEKAAKNLVKARRIDPKLFIQNERTYIQWCKLGVITGALAAGMFNFVTPAYPQLRQYGTAMTFAAAGIIIYSFLLYIWRLRRIRMKKETVAFSWGPFFVTIILVTLLVMSAILQIRLGGAFSN